MNLEYSTFETTKVALKNVSACSLSKHLYEQANIGHIYFESIVLGIAFHRKPSDVCIVAAADNTCIF